MWIIRKGGKFLVNKSKILIAIALPLFLFFSSSKVYALQTVTLTEGESTFVDISEKDLNLIKFSSPDIKVYTGSKVVDIKVDGNNIFVSLTDKTVSIPQEVFFVAPSGTYSLILVPKGIPAETIIVRTPGEDIHDAIQWENSHDYITGLKELIKSMYAGIPPMGFTVKDINKDVTRWKGTAEALLSTYTGATLEGEVYELANTSDKPIRIVEKEFYEKGVLSVSIDRHELKPKEKTRIYVVKRSESQKQMDQFLKKQNPLDILKEKGSKGGS